MSSVGIPLPSQQVGRLYLGRISFFDETHVLRIGIDALPLVGQASSALQITELDEDVMAGKLIDENQSLQLRDRQKGGYVRPRGRSAS